MKKRLEKKAEKLRRKKIHEMLDVVMDIDRLTVAARFEFSGVSNGCWAYICKDPYDPCQITKMLYAFEAFRGDYDELLKDLKEERKQLQDVRQV